MYWGSTDENLQEELDHITLKYLKLSTWSVLGDDMIDFDSWHCEHLQRMLYISKGSYGLGFYYLETYSGYVFEDIGKHGRLGTKGIQVYTINGDETGVQVEK